MEMLEEERMRKQERIRNGFVEEGKALELAEMLAVPSHSNGIEFVTLDRLNRIEEELKGTKYSCKVDGVIFRLYSQKAIGEIEGKLLVVSSHADCLQLEPVFEAEMEKHPKRMRGIFDNSITNSAAVYLMKYFDLPENVVFVFTGDEESEEETAAMLGKINMDYKKTDACRRELREREGLEEDDEIDMMGAYAVCKYLKREGKDFHAIVLDCTYSAFDKKADFTLENDFIYRRDREWLNKMIGYLLALDEKWNYIPADADQKDDNPEDYVDSKDIIKMLPKEYLSYEEGEIEVALDDESYEYDARDISCISFCLPCDAGNMHRQKGFGIRRKSYFRYIRTLYGLCSL